MSRWWRADAVASHAQAYQRSPLDPPPAERTSQRRLSFSSAVTASAQVSFVPAARVSMKSDGTRSTYAWPLASKNSRSWVQLPYTSSPQAKSKPMPPAYASAQMSMASWPLVRNLRSGGSPMSRDLAGSPMCSAGIHWRAPISACPVFSRTYDRCTVLIPFATRPAHPRYWRFTPQVASPAFSCPVSSIAPITRCPRRRFPRRAASSSPATANRHTTPIAAKVSQLA
jgi:hypothetical protein